MAELSRPFTSSLGFFPLVREKISLVRENSIWVVASFLYELKKNSSLFTRVVYHVDLKRIIIVKRQNASSHLFTPLHAYAYLNCVKTREDMWRPEATLHICNELYPWMLPYIREEWRLFSFFVFFNKYDLQILSL